MSNPIALALLIVVVASVVAADDTPPFKITTKCDNDRVEVKAEKDKAIFSIRSPFGISNAVIERADEKWPDAIVLRLQLKGLENFKVTSEKMKLEGAASIQEGKLVIRAWKDGMEDERLDAKSPYWIDVRILGGDSQPAKGLPLKDGYFELRLPKALFESNPKSITVNWIDYYRN